MTNTYYDARLHINMYWGAHITASAPKLAYTTSYPAETAFLKLKAEPCLERAVTGLER